VRLVGVPQLGRHPRPRHAGAGARVRAYDPVADRVTDPWRGQTDLAAKLIRAVGDPAGRGVPRRQQLDDRRTAPARKVHLRELNVQTQPDYFD